MRNIKGTKIAGLGVYLPKKMVTARELAAERSLPLEWLEGTIGVTGRHIASAEETSPVMGAQAARAAMRNAGTTIEDIDMIIGASGVPHQPIPCNAALIQRELGRDAAGIPCFDINSTCLSFLNAVEIATLQITSGRVRHVLVVSSEVASAGLDWRHKESAALFGDGAAAAVIGPGEHPSLLAFAMQTHGEGSEICRIAGGLTGRPAYRWTERDAREYLFFMDGPKLFRTAATHMPALIEALFDEARLGWDDIDWVVPHQASRRAMTRMAKVLGLRWEAVISVVERYGNCIAASIPIAFHTAVEDGRIKRGDTVLMLGTSAGLSLAGMVWRY